MHEIGSLSTAIFNVHDSDMFEEVALQVYRHQYEHCFVYRDFAGFLRRTPDRVKSLSQIPFVPVEFFRDFRMISDILPGNHLVFESSGTSGTTTSKHYVSDESMYLRSLTEGFIRVFGDPSKYRILALLPGYLDRPNSSLVYMTEQLMRLSSPDSGFFFHDFDGLKQQLLRSKVEDQVTMLIGVSHALLDFIELYSFGCKDLIVVETGGMKGRREELVREDLHSRIKDAFAIDKIASEYGMTELLSQAWSLGEGLFHAPPWMKVIIRDPNDPYHAMPLGRSGGINVIDLANVNSCSFIATQDLGRSHPDGVFEVLGRFDHSDLRGCNLLAGQGLT